MTTYGITDAGLVRKPYEIILSDMQDKARLLFGDNTDLSSESFDGLLVQLMAYAIDQESWQVIEDVYYGLFPDTAIGASLSRTVGFGGITRAGATSAVVLLTITGDPLAAVSASFQAGTNQSVDFQVLEAGALDGTGTGSFWATAVTAGLAGNVPSGTIDLIVTAEPGIDAVTNAASATGGGDSETDSDLLLRYQAQFATAGSSTPGILSALRDIGTVATANVVENYTEVTDADGLPAKSFECILTGGILPVEVATVIFNKKPAGIRPYGAESYVVTDTQGESHTMYWSEAADIRLYVIVTITSNANWETGSIEDVKTNIIKYIGGVDSQPTTPITYDGLAPGGDVFNWKAKAVNFGSGAGSYVTVDGVDDITVYIGRAPAPATEANVAMLLREKATLASGDITVNVV